MASLLPAYRWTGPNAISDYAPIAKAVLIPYAVKKVESRYRLTFAPNSFGLISLTNDVRSAIVILLLPTMAVNVVNILRGGHWRQSIGRFWLLALFGAMGSLLAGTVNVMVPALIIFALEMGLSPLVTVQLFNFCFLLGKLSQSVILTSYGHFGGPQMVASLHLAATALVALCVGIRFRDRINAEVYRIWLRRALGTIAIILIMQYVSGIIKSGAIQH